MKFARIVKKFSAAQAKRSPPGLQSLQTGTTDGPFSWKVEQTGTELT
jgi:hypothetical protein